MNILIAPNSMKGSLSAKRFAKIVEDSLLQNENKFAIRKMPIADGGDGSGEILTDELKLKTIIAEVQNPLGYLISAKFGYSNGTAVIEMANASGMKLLKNTELNPLIASSFGTGQLIHKAMELGANKILLCIGGSATVDGGMGMLEALGVRFFDDKKKSLKGNGKNLQKIHKIDTSGLESYNNPVIKIISDVTNPLLGNNGAAKVFGPQKGATAQMILKLEAGLSNFAHIIQLKTGMDVTRISGCGAAGGISTGLLGFLNAEIVNGADFILDAISIDNHIQWADAIITGEGKLDSQTLNNKAPYALAKRATNQKKPTYAIVGQSELKQSKLYKKIISLSTPKISVSTSIKNTEKLVFIRTRELANYLLESNN